MLQLVATGAIRQNGEIIGYNIKDTNGSEKGIKVEAIINALKYKQVSISNLSLTEDGKLVEVNGDNNNTGNIIDNTAEYDNNINQVDRIQYLVSKLNSYRKSYYADNKEIVSNFEYDKLYDELKALEDKTGYILQDSPTQTVGYDDNTESEVVNGLEKEKHSTRMLSLDKTKDINELKKFLGNKPGILSWKMDGLTVVLIYDNGKLEKAITRGNGEVGEIVTHTAKQFKNIPRKIAFQGRLELRGEAIIKYSDFARINSNDEYKNPRNLCSGSVRQLDSAITASRNVNWYCFEVVKADGLSMSNNIDEQFEKIRLLGFQCVEHYNVTSSDIDERIIDLTNRVKSFDIPCDGLVLTYRDKQYGLSLGETSHAPRHSIAFKWEDEVAKTQIVDIEWSPSRNGLLTPVAIFKPVDIEGSTVQRASLHNVSIFLDLEIGIGDTVGVYKANMIIPQISENFTRSGNCEIPGQCPCCGEPTQIHEEEKSGVLTLWCDNPLCSIKGSRSFEHFVSRDAMNIDGISTATIDKLVDVGVVSDYASLFHIKEHAATICNMEGFGYQSFKNMCNAVEKARNVKLHNLIYALGIPNIGLNTAKLICRHFKNNTINTINSSYNELVNIDGIGEIIAASFTDFFADNDNRQMFVKLAHELNIIEEEVSSDTSMNGIVICVTGAVHIFPNRDAVKEIVESKGGKLTGSVSRSTSYLVTNDTTSGSRKNRAAQEFGIPILTEEEFINKFNIKV